jgi:hypothetical protein
MTRRNSRIGVRIPAKDVVKLRRICESRGEDLSDFVRRAIRTEMAKLSFLGPLDKKALGVKAEGDSGEYRE